MSYSKSNPATVLERQKTTQKYPEARVIVLDDDINTFEHVAKSLMKVIPGMNEKKAWERANQVDKEGSAEVWSGPLEQAELYHQQLLTLGLTMAPIQRF